MTNNFLRMKKKQEKHQMRTRKIFKIMENCLTDLNVIVFAI